MSVIILLSLVAFSGSGSPIMDGRKPTTRETIALRKITATRRISFQQARQQFIANDFLRKADLVSLTFVRLEDDRLSKLCLQVHEQEKPDLVKTFQALQLHAPRSTDDLPNLS